MAKKDSFLVKVAKAIIKNSVQKRSATEDVSKKYKVPEMVYTFRVKDVLKVIDGDTVKVLVDLGFYTFKQVKIRCVGYDAPEIFHPKTEKEKKAGLKVKQFFEKELRTRIKNHGLLLKTAKSTDVYGRWLGEFIDAETGENINHLVKEFMKENHLLKEEL